MKVAISFTLDIDPDAWTLAYGTPRPEVRADVQNHVEGQVREMLTSSGEGFLKVEA